MFIQKHDTVGRYIVSFVQYNHVHCHVSRLLKVRTRTIQRTHVRQTFFYTFTAKQCIFTRFTKILRTKGTFERLIVRFKAKREGKENRETIDQ